MYDTSLFSHDFLNQLSYLKALLKKKFLSEIGNISSPQTGNSLDFKGYRHYVFGDDLRYLDWSAYARTDELYLKEFFKEEKNTFLIIIDHSSSMNYGTPQKSIYSIQIAAATAYLGLHYGCSVRVGIVENSHFILSKTFENGKQFYELLSFLSWRKTKGIFSFSPEILQTIISCRRSFVFLCSDLLSAGGMKNDLHKIVLRGHELTLFHLLSKEEEIPSWNGEFELEDTENHMKAFVNMTPEVMNEYRREVVKFKDSWLRFCKCHKIRYSFSNTNENILTVLYKGLSFLM